MWASLRLGVRFSMNAGRPGATVLLTEPGLLADLLGVGPGDVLLGADGAAFATARSVQAFAAYDGRRCAVYWFDASLSEERRDEVVALWDAGAGRWRLARPGT